MDARARATRIRLMAFDIDGVMTDGGLYYTDEGHELKRFNVQDGFALKLAQRAGIELAIITGRSSGVVAARAADLGIEYVFQGVTNKRETLATLLERLAIPWPEASFMGDDLIDLPAMQQCGLAIAPANGHALVKERAHTVTEASGGHGAVREAIEFVLSAQDKFNDLIEPWLKSVMKRFSGQLFPILLLGFLTALSYWLERTVDIPDSKHDGKRRHDPDAIAETFTVRRFNIEGDLQYFLTAPKMLHYPDDDSSSLTDAKLTYYRPGAPDMTIFGQEALVTAKGETVYLTREVVATRAPLVDRPELVATMPDLTVHPDAGTAHTDSPVEITQGPTWIKGVGLSLDNNASVVNLHSQVTGLIFRNKSQP